MHKLSIYFIFKSKWIGSSIAIILECITNRKIDVICIPPILRIPRGFNKWDYVAVTVQHRCTLMARQTIKSVCIAWSKTHVIRIIFPYISRYGLFAYHFYRRRWFALSLPFASLRYEYIRIDNEYISAFFCCLLGSFKTERSKGKMCFILPYIMLTLYSCWCFFFATWTP